jgi:hypothetical protein
MYRRRHRRDQQPVIFTRVERGDRGRGISAEVIGDEPFTTQQIVQPPPGLPGVRGSHRHSSVR